MVHRRLADINTATVGPCHTRYKRSLMRDTATHQWSCLYHKINDVTKMLQKNQHIFAYNGLPRGGGLPPREAVVELMLSSN